MKISITKCVTLKLTELDRLDPITVFLENYEPGKGKIIIECYGQSWSAYWGGMSGNPVEKFFCSCHASYLAGNLSSVDSSIPDFEKIHNDIKAAICRARRKGEISALDARIQYDDAPVFDSVGDVWHSTGAMEMAYGRDWYERCLPTKPNPDYEYLCRIIEAVKLGLAEYIDEQKAA